MFLRRRVGGALICLLLHCELKSLENLSFKCSTQTVVFGNLSSALCFSADVQWSRWLASHCRGDAVWEHTPRCPFIAPPTQRRHTPGVQSLTASFSGSANVEPLLNNPLWARCIHEPVSRREQECEEDAYPTTVTYYEICMQLTSSIYSPPWLRLFLKACKIPNTEF